MTPKAPFTTEQIAGINAAARGFEAKVLALHDAAQAAFSPVAEKMRAVVRSMQEKP